MTVRNIRARISGDPALGAGTVLSVLAANGVDPDRPTLTFDTDVDGHPAWQPLTLDALQQAVAARAASLHELGVKPRDPVVVCASRSADQILVFLALVSLGAIPAMVNPNLPEQAAAGYIQRLRAMGVLTDARTRARLAPLELGTPMLGDVEALGHGKPQDAPAPYQHHAEDPIAITHTSGTIGFPKAVISTHASLFAAIRHRLSMPRPQGADRTLCALPTAHNATLTALNLSLCNGGELMLLSQQGGPAVLDAIERWHPGMVLGFAVTWSELATANLTQRDLDSVAVWWNTGDCAHEGHIRRLVKVGSHQVAARGGPVRRSGSMFVDGLGSTEMGHSQFHITHRPDTSRYDRCIGRPHPFTTVQVIDGDGHPVPAGTVGQLAVRSPTLNAGYWNDSATTYRARLDGWFLPGELVYQDEEGYFYHVDRASDAIDLGDGIRVYTALAEERVLAACRQVIECTVVAVREGGDVVTHVLLRLDPQADPDADYTDAVRSAVRDDQVAATIRRVVVVPEQEIPLGATGKVRKAVLRERYASQAQVTAPVAGA
jgi:acyl-coenzyme A synthetase/AMP-(fatty) acid ligase